MKLAPILSALLILGLAPATTHAFGNANAKMQLHLTPPFTSQQCTRPETNPSCDQIDTSGGLYPNLYFANVLVTDASAAEGVQGVALGIQYDAAPGSGVDVFGWGVCAPLELVSMGWPNSGGNDLVSWGSGGPCQQNEPGGPGTGVVTHIGYFYCASYNASEMRIAAVNLPSNAQVHRRVVVTNCAGQSDVIDDLDNPHVPSQLGSAAFSASGLVEGDNPCLKVVPVAISTWSAIKSRLESNLEVRP